MITDRAAGLRRSLRLEYLTVGWNVVEAAVALAAAVVAGSTALVAFGGDSLVESLSGAVLIWRLLAEGRDQPTLHSTPVELLKVDTASVILDLQTDAVAQVGHPQRHGSHPGFATRLTLLRRFDAVIDSIA